MSFVLFDQSIAKNVEGIITRLNTHFGYIVVASCSSYNSLEEFPSWEAPLLMPKWTTKLLQQNNLVFKAPRM